MSGQNTRKRPAPSASPIVSIQRNVQQPYSTDHNAGQNPLVQWNGTAGTTADNTNFMGSSSHGDGAFGLAPGQPYQPQHQHQRQPQHQQGVSSPSNSLARRQMNQALVAANPRGAYNAPADQWAGFDNGVLLVSQNPTEVPAEQDNVEVLEEMAQKVKREALTKRKQIPPFVQKLSSFLEERKNEELIRWSEKGDSFIVLDEDEFAKTLIPELFKHNNYASFVRQLNMYGFHKCVGLSDNSMRASERKNKSPSEYSNPYFRRGYPNLLWLINKPKSGGKSKKGGKNQDGDVDSDDEIVQEEVTGPPGMGMGMGMGMGGMGIGMGMGMGPSSAGARSLPAAGSDSQPIQKKEMALIREELHKVREQQKLILGAINRMQRSNDELYNQAIMFQSQHDRHQNSINAILNFLANVFRKTLEDQGSSQNVGDIISSLISNQGQQSHQGSVFDLGDFVQSQTDSSSPLSGPLPKKARQLLPPIPNHSDSVVSSSRAPSVASSYHPVGASTPEMGHVTELLDTSPAETSPNLHQELRTNPHESMMKIINDHNAINSTGLDLPEAREIVANAPNQLNNDQRSKLVNLMAGQSSAPPVPNVMAVSNPPAAAAAASIPNTSTAPSHATPLADTTPAPSLSPILRNSAVPSPSLHHISTNKSDLEQLKRLQSEQDAKITELSDRLGPLSPSGHVPGFGVDDDAAYFDAPNIDMDQFLNSDAFLTDVNFGDGTDFNFNLDGDGLMNSGLDPAGAQVKNHDTPSPTGTEEILRDDLGIKREPDRGSKRQRVG